MASQKSESLKTYQGKTYYYITDNETNTYKIYYANNEEFQNDGGTLVYEEKLDTLKNGSSDTITNQNEELIEVLGGLPFIDSARNSVASAVWANKTNIDRASIDSFPTEDTVWGTLSRNLPNSSDATNDEQTIIDQAVQAAQNTFDDIIDAAKNVQIPDISGVANLPNIGGGSVLRYPLDMDERVQDYLEISIYSYKAAKRLPTVGADTEIDIPGSIAATRLNKLLEVIQLPIPNAIADQNAVGWGEGQMTGIEGSVASTVAKTMFGEAGGEGFLEQLSEYGASLAVGAGNLADVVSQKFIRRRLVAGLLAKAAGNLGVNIDVSQAVTRLGGVVENPNLELLFSGPSLREFTFRVRMSPRNQKESERIRQIIRALKQHSAVKKGVTFFKDDNATNFLLGTPDVFRLRYVQGGSNTDIKGLNKFKTCALRSLQVDYSGEAGRWAAYDADSQPITTTVTMNFAELVPIYDVDYTTGFANDDVGF